MTLVARSCPTCHHSTGGLRGDCEDRWHAAAGKHLDRVLNWCGRAERHRPHGGCNGFGWDAGPGRQVIEGRTA